MNSEDRLSRHTEDDAADAADRLREFFRPGMDTRLPHVVFWWSVVTIGCFLPVVFSTIMTELAGVVGKGSSVAFWAVAWPAELIGFVHVVLAWFRVYLVNAVAVCVFCCLLLGPATREQLGPRERITLLLAVVAHLTIILDWLALGRPVGIGLGRWAIMSYFWPN